MKRIFTISIKFYGKEVVITRPLKIFTMSFNDDTGTLNINHYLHTMTKKIN